METFLRNQSCLISFTSFSFTGHVSIIGKGLANTKKVTKIQNTWRDKLYFYIKRRLGLYFFLVNGAKQSIQSPLFSADSWREDWQVSALRGHFFSWVLNSVPVRWRYWNVTPVSKLVDLLCHFDAHHSQSPHTVQLLERKGWKWWRIYTNRAI